MYSATHHEWPIRQTGTAPFTVYADFNCPFSYALNERLFEMGLDQQVDFRLIQHLPAAKSAQGNLETLWELTAEVAEVRRRAPAVDINAPVIRPSSAPAAALVYAVARVDPYGATLLRRRIYRALWVEGRDISSAEVLAGLVLDLDLELPDRDITSADELGAWQSEWNNNTEFERNLPIVISERGETLIGFPLDSELGAFLESGSLLGATTLAADPAIPLRQRILVLDDDANSLRMIIEQMHDVQVEVAEDLIGLIAHVRNLGMPDLLIVNTGLVGSLSGSDWWRNLTNSDPDPSIPIVHILERQTREAEVAALEAGAADLLVRPFHPKLLRSRLHSQLRSRRALQQSSSIARVDALTSIGNRREFDARLRSDWGRCARAGDSLALLMIDVDGLRAFNDSHGHLQGDRCLVMLAQRMGACMRRAEDLIARYRGGSFVALLPGVDAHGAMKVAQDCSTAVENACIPHPASPVGPHVSVAIGAAALVPARNQASSLLLEQAEVALFQAKRLSGRRVAAYDHDD